MKFRIGKEFYNVLTHEFYKLTCVVNDYSIFTRLEDAKIFHLDKKTLEDAINIGSLKVQNIQKPKYL